MAQRKDFRTVVRGVELAIRESGAGRPVIWGHGLLSSMAQEDDVGVLDWAEEVPGVRWIRYDARGHGESEANYEPSEYRWDELSEDMLSLADALKVKRPVLGGVSMGCATSLHAAVAHPRRVAALVLMAPPTAWDSRPRQARIYRYAAGLVSWTGLGAFRLLASALPSPSSSDSFIGRMQNALLAHLGRADANAVVAALRGASESDLPPLAALGTLTMPVLILAWKHDPVHPVSSAEKLATAIPGAELHVASDLAQIRGWPDKVRDFLDQLKR